MPVMPGKDHPTEEPAADPGPEQPAAEPHADIVARLLEYQRRLREETGEEPAPFKEREASRPIEDERVPSDESEISEEASEPEEPSQPDPAAPAPDEAGSEPPDARQLKERIDRLDETLARISAMLPLLKGEPKRDPES
jgi:hypothetical protein